MTAASSIVMVTSSYPRFPGDVIATFMEPIATGVAARGHEVHLVAPYHPDWKRKPVESGVHFTLYRYAPTRSLNVFGYAGALRADVRLRSSAIAIAPVALAAGVLAARRTVRRERPSLVHAHWVIPGGVTGALAAGRRPLVISLHGSDVFVAERHAAARRAARMAFQRASWVTACSEDLRTRAVALGADPARTSVIPYGVDADRFAPDAAARAARRKALGIGDEVPVVFAFGRLARKKGFEYLIAAIAALKRGWPALRLVLAGDGDLAAELREQVAAAGILESVHFLGAVPHDQIPAWLSAADVAVVPSVHDAAGNVDGLPNTVMEIMASSTPLVATRVGGIAAVATDGSTASLVAERDPAALAGAIDTLLRNPAARRAIGERARQLVRSQYAWANVAEQFDEVYRRALEDAKA